MGFPYTPFQSDWNDVPAWYRRLVDDGLIFLPGSAVTAESFGASPNASAAFNTTALQNALSLAGIITLFTPGIYQINNTLVIPTNTAWLSTLGVTIQAIPKVGSSLTYNLIRNANSASTVFTLTSVIPASFSNSEYVITVTFPSPHGQLAGQYFELVGDTTDTYNGIWRILDVPSNVTLRFIIATGNASPPSGAGTMLGMAADGNISIQNLAIDANFRGGFTVSNGVNDHAMMFNKVTNLRVTNTQSLDSAKFGLMTCNTQHLYVSGMDFESNSDGVKVYGPAWYPYVENLSGTTGDDTVSLQTVEDAAFTAYMPQGVNGNAGGSIWCAPVTFRNIHPRATRTMAVAIYPNGGASSDSGYAIRNPIVIDGVGTQSKLAASGAYCGGTPLGIGEGFINVPSAQPITVIARNVVPFPMVGTSTVGALCYVTGLSGKTLLIDQLIIDGVGMDPALGTLNNGLNLNFCSINSLSLQNGKIAGYGGGILVFIPSSNCTVKKLSYDNLEISAVGGNYDLFSFSGTPTINVFRFNNIRLQTSVHLHNINGGLANTPDVFIHDVVGDSGSTICSIGAWSENLYLQNVVSAGTLFNFFGASGTIQVWASGVRATGTVTQNFGAGGTINWFNPDGSIPVDITKISRVACGMAKHNGGTAAGTIVTNNLCVCDATGAANSWHQLSAPIANVY